MNTIDFSNGIRFVAGFRAENTSDDVHNLAFGNNSVAPNAFSGSYHTLLSSASLRFNAGSDDYVSLIYARGILWPDPQDIAQPLSWTVTGNGSNKYSVSFGNANLKAETGDDIDVLYDHYFKQFGMISAGYFYKSLHDPIGSPVAFSRWPTQMSYLTQAKRAFNDDLNGWPIPTSPVSIRSADLMKPEAAARKLAIGKNHLRELTVDGRIPAIDFGTTKHLWRYHEPTLNAWLPEAREDELQRVGRVDALMNPGNHAMHSSEPVPDP